MRPKASFSILARSFSGQPQPRHAAMLLGGLWLVLYFAALFAPPLLDDADATHASAARAMAVTGDVVTLKVDGVRYLEKAPLPYWVVALSFRVFGFTAFAVHLPEALAVGLLALLGHRWANQAFGARTAFYTALAVLTSAGVFLFTRIFIPEVTLSLLLGASLFGFLKSLHPEAGGTAPARPVLGLEERPAVAWYAGSYFYPGVMWGALALAVLTKGLVALVFFFGAGGIYLVVTGEWREWRRLKPFSGVVLFLAIAAPWHVLAGLRNTGGDGGHGFFWFYFVNEHFLRFLGKRVPMDYNKMPGYLFWGLHLVWLFPWSLLAPLVVVAARRNGPWREATGFAGRTVLLLGIFAGLTLVFFSVSTNQEYYTFPAYLPLLLLGAAALTWAERMYVVEDGARRWVGFAHGALTVLGVVIAGALGYGLWVSRGYPYVRDIGALLAHRGVGDYTLSMSHFFDLTGASFAALRLPAALAAAAFALGPGIAWMLRTQRRHVAATTAIALTSGVFLFAAHLALVRFGPMLSSKAMAVKIMDLEKAGAMGPNSEVMLFGDQAYGSSIPFYLGRQVMLVDGRSTSMWFGSTFGDAPKVFMTSDEMVREWGVGERKVLFVPMEKRDEVERLLGGRGILLMEMSDKALMTDRGLDR